MKSFVILAGFLGLVLAAPAADAQCTGGTMIGTCGPGDPSNIGCCDDQDTVTWCENGNLCELNCGGTVIPTNNCCTARSTPGCCKTNVQNCVCAFDPYCCAFAWDSYCVSEAKTYCGGNGACGCTATYVGRGGSTGGNCCAAHNNPGCCEASVETCVCAADPYCCQVTWDEICAGEATSLCGATCPSACTNRGPLCGYNTYTDKYDCTGVYQTDPTHVNPISCLAPGACNVDADCNDGVTCTQDICVAGECVYDTANCPFFCDAGDPHLLLLLDYSGSMNEYPCQTNAECASGYTCEEGICLECHWVCDPWWGCWVECSSLGLGKTKWELAIEAIYNALSAYGYAAEFAVKLFPSPGQGTCGVTNTADVPFGSTALQASNFLFAQPTFGSRATPIGASLNASDAIYSDPTLAGSNKYVVLITDGYETCADCDSNADCPIGGTCSAYGSCNTGFLATQTLQANGVDTFVVGFGSGVDGAALTEMAIAGGHAKATDPAYYAADTAGDLENAILSILQIATGETCNGIDDDCNGLTDDNVPPQTCFGTCGEGVQYCVNGAWDVCQLPIEDEICDNFDNNCNGIVDDQWHDGVGPNVGDACVAGVGACMTLGQYVCPADGLSEAVCNAVAGAPGTETCNGIDDDCDGFTDNVPGGPTLLTQPCYSGPPGTAGVGACVGGVSTCDPGEGEYGPCVGEVLPTPETCDSIDNNCNGSTDEIPLCGGCTLPAATTCNTPVYAEAFEGCNAAWTFDDWSGSGVGWQLDTYNTTSPNTSLYMGDPASRDYDAGWVSNQATSEVLTLPAVGPGESLKLTFNAWYETEGGIWDWVLFGVIDASGVHLLWTQSGTSGGWESVTADLTPYAGTQVQLFFAFETFDHLYNAYEGVYIDDLQLDVSVDQCCTQDSDCSDGITCSADSCVASSCGYDYSLCPGFCGNTTPQMLILLDFSSSMNEFGGGGATKWEAALEALYDAMAAYGYVADFALKTFPSPGAVDGCTVEPGLDQGFGSTPFDITSYLYNLGLPPGGTPMGAGLSSAVSAFAGAALDPDDPKYVILITDGVEECGGDPVNAAQALANQGIETFVIGFGANIDQDVLNTVAVLGGNAKPDDGSGNLFYQADSEGDLNAALLSIFQSAAAETCNGIDDDCDGQTDEVEDVGTLSCSGPCGDGVRECIGGDWGPCQLDDVAEVCNGLDDNCNGVPDDPWYDGSMGPILGTACVAGSGACMALGQYVCPPSGTGPAVCNAVAGTGGVEVCNGIDDDCDGQTDNIAGTGQLLSQSCYSGAPGEVGKGICKSGLQVCNPVTGTWGACNGQVVPANEVCDGIDNNCNGATDEVPGCCATAADCNDGVACTADACVNHVCTWTETCPVCIPNGGNVLILVDYSSNMGSESATGQTKWDAMVTGLAASLPLYEDEMYMAVKLFRTPGLGGCSVNPTSEEVPFDASATDVINYLGGLSPNGASPIVQGLYAAETVYDNHPEIPEGTKFVLLITKGTASCGGDQVAAIDYLASQGIYTFVMGFDKAQNDNTLYEMVLVGGFGKDPGTGFTYYAADSEGDVETALDEIAGITAVGNEFCNGIDDDCDGFTDEGLGTLTCISECNGKQGFRECVNGTWSECQANPDGEVCDGVDNDCNGTTDDPWAGQLGQNCFSGTGACMATGQFVCGADQASVTCNATPGTGGAELCDGIDNDCDGGTDEDPSNPSLPMIKSCYTGPAGTAGVAACKAGVQVCSGGAWDAVCSGEVLPQAEKCDNLDNDCNGITDDSWTDNLGPKLGGACTVGLGTCAKPGVYVCPPSGVGEPVCDATPGTPGAEVCDGLDNDCDGFTDENPANPTQKMTQSCYTGPAGTQGVGLCKSGTQQCLGLAGWGACSGQVTPVAEVCDGLNNDCDGQTDEDASGAILKESCYPFDPATLGVGECKAGLKTCGGAAGYGACTGAVGPVAEICDGKDNDCDAFTDEDPSNPLLKMSQSCYTGPAGTSGVGQCTPGTAMCLGASGYGSCDGQVLPGTEICDGIDNDCDGLSDPQEPGPGGTAQQHPCYGQPGCTLGTCFCFENQTTHVWSCILE